MAWCRIYLNELEHSVELTGCKKPCVYKKYSLVGEKQKTGFVHDGFVHDGFVFSLWALSNSTTIATEVLVYPWTSLVAEFGGTLGMKLNRVALLETDHLCDKRRVQKEKKANYPLFVDRRPTPSPPHSLLIKIIIIHIKEFSDCLTIFDNS